MSAQAPLVDGLDLAGWRERALQAEAQLVRARALVEGLQAQTEQRLQEQQARITALERQMAELAARQNQDSINSHKPPSRDNDKSRSKRKGRNRKSRRSSGRKAGGQPGHKGHHRALHPIDEVDHIVDLMPENCERCHASLDGRQAEDNPTRYKQSELPPGPAHPHRAQGPQHLVLLRTHDPGCHSQRPDVVYRPPIDGDHRRSGRTVPPVPG